MEALKHIEKIFVAFDHCSNSTSLSRIHQTRWISYPGHFSTNFAKKNHMLREIYWFQREICIYPLHSYLTINMHFLIYSKKASLGKI